MSVFFNPAPFSLIQNLMVIIQKKEMRICFLSRAIHYVLLNETGKLIGGAELQQKILMDALIDQGWKVFVVTEKVNQKKKIKLDKDFTMLPVLDFSNRNKYLRKLILLPLNLWKTLKEIGADVYYHRNPDYFSGIIALFCKIHEKKFVLAGANNWNFDKGNEGNLNNFADKISARYAIRCADQIIVQNSRQKELLRVNYKRESDVFYNIFNARELRKRFLHILWAARIVPYKRPRWFLEFAQMLPGQHFVMVGGKGADVGLEEEIKEKSAGLGNVRYLGHRSFEEVEKLFDETSIFVNTSIPDCEGFPNTFLQAWSRGISVISFFDPDGLIAANNLGVVVESIPQMKEAFEFLIKEQGAGMEYSLHIQDFFLREFSIESKIGDFIRILKK